MRVISLGYHDIIDSGSPSGDTLRAAAGAYALNRHEFRSHLQAVHSSQSPVSVVQQAIKGTTCSVLFTFDDGAIGSYRYAADELENLGWRGHFFITTDWISKRGFMEPAHIRDLHRRGHIIGSHTCSHPSRMSSLPPERLRHEWSASCKILENILGAPVDVASVSDGYYSKRVGLSAQASGIQYLFNSEPTDRPEFVSDCLVLGRFPIFSSSPPSLARAYAAGERLPRLRQSVAWNIKKLLKSVGGQTYLTLRRAVLSRSVPR